MLPQEMRAPEPLNTPPVPVQLVAANGTKPVSETGHAVVSVMTLDTVDVETEHEATLLVVGPAMLPPAKALLVVERLDKPDVLIVEVMVGEATGAVIVM